MAACDGRLANGKNINNRDNSGEFGAKIKRYQIGSYPDCADLHYLVVHMVALLLIESPSETSHTYS